MLRLAFEEWDDNQQGDRPDPAIHRAWIKFVLKQTLGLPDEVLAEGQEIPQTLKATIAEHGETLRPDVVVAQPRGRARRREGPAAGPDLSAGAGPRQAGRRRGTGRRRRRPG